MAKQILGGIKNMKNSVTKEQIDKILSETFIKIEKNGDKITE